MERLRIPRGEILASSLAVEVTSPGDSDSAVQAEIEQYLATGTPRAWVVRPKLATATVHRPGGDAQRYHRDDNTLTSGDAGSDIDGLRRPLATLFPEG